MESSSQHSVLFIIGKIVSLPMDTYFEANKANEKNYRIQIQLSNSSFAVVGVSIQQIYNYEKYRNITLYNTYTLWNIRCDI